MLRLLAKNGAAVVVDVPPPELRSGEVLVASAYSVTSPGTERGIIRATAGGSAESHEYPRPGYHWRQLRDRGSARSRSFPRQPTSLGASLGYSVAGTVVALADDVEGVALGERVACSGSQCAFHAATVAIPRGLMVPVPDDVASEDAAFVTLGAIAMESLRRTGCKFGETVLVCGVGLLGLLVTQLARSAGIYAIGLDLDPARLELAAANGATRVLCGTTEESLRAIAEATGGFGADAVIVGAATDDAELLNFAFDALRPGGAVVALGDFAMEIDRQRFFGAQATLVPSLAYGPGRYDPMYEEHNVDYPISAVRWTERRNMALFLRLLAERRVDLGLIPTLRCGLSEAPGAYTTLAERRGPLTAVFSYGDDDLAPPDRAPASSRSAGEPAPEA